MKNKIPTCKSFTGYKPCHPDHNCWENGCKENIPHGTKILIINLDAMGDVLMTTAQLTGLKRKFPQSTIHWITLKIAAPLLHHNHLIDKVWEYNFESLSILQNIKFDYVMNVDKSQRSCSILNSVNSENKLGFGMDENGKIIPVNKGAYYNYQLGMDDHLKFKVNQRTGQDYLAETFENDYRRDRYVFNFTDDENEFIESYRADQNISDGDFIVGFNTGCSNLYPNKKMTVEQHIAIIDKLLQLKKYKIMLLGGPEDTERNSQISRHFGDKIINTPTSEGVRRGACYESIPQVIVTGDSFGMHLAIALQKYVIAWFGLSCWTEIDLYDNGVKLIPEGLDCAPCWKKKCPFNLECIQMIDLENIVNSIEEYFNRNGKK
ncbi:MAG: glycosyl transferase family 9 [Melioribacteraceae bacterium]|nr:MAG: glycosyl transferase family 9 [Melioribacteraceae bacterium]